MAEVNEIIAGQSAARARDARIRELLTELLLRDECRVDTADGELGLDACLPPVLVGDDRGHWHRSSIRIQRLDDAVILLGHEPAAHLTGARDFLVVRVQLFV